MHIRIVLFVCYIVISFPLFVLYIIELCLLSIRSEFSSSFYTLFLFTGVIDIIFFTMNLFFYYLPFLPGVSQFYSKFQDEEWNLDWRPEYSWMLSIANTLMYYLPAVQDVTNLLVSSNRFLAMLFPLLFRKLFTRAITLALIVLIILYSFVPCFVTIAAPGFFIDISSEDDDEKIYMLHAESMVHFPSINRSTIIFVHMLICNGLCFLIYTIIAARILRAKEISNSTEIRLFMLGLLILLTNIPSIIYQAYWSIYQSDGSSSVFMCLPWVIMIKTLTPPLFMLIINAGMRRELRLLLPCRLHGSVMDSSTRNVTVTSCQATMQCQATPEVLDKFNAGKALLKAKPAILDDAMSKLSHAAQEPARKFRELMLQEDMDPCKFQMAGADIKAGLPEDVLKELEAFKFEFAQILGLW